VNNADLFFGKPFTEFTVEDFEALSTVNFKGFLYRTQGSVKQMRSDYDHLDRQMRAGDGVFLDVGVLTQSLESALLKGREQPQV
jgi:NAD(P)-dependent dehydrogenase (short-subunit alcohol dehydrogenase family)